MAVPPYITVTYDPPLPSDTGAAFSAKAFDTVAKFNPWSTAANGLADYVNDTADDALAAAVAAAAGNLDAAQRETFAGYLVGVSEDAGNPLEAVEIVERPELTQVQVENAASTVMGAVSGERLAQAVAANAPAQSYELLSRAVTSGSPAAVDFTFDPALYDAIVFAFSNVSPATDGAGFLFQTSADGGATFHTNYNYTRWRGGTSTTYATRSGTSASACEVSLQNGSAANEFLSGYLSVFNAAHAAFTQIVSDVVYENLTGELFSDRGTGISQTSAVVNAARFSWSSGNFDNDCVITMYGVHNS